MKENGEDAMETKRKPNESETEATQKENGTGTNLIRKETKRKRNGNKNRNETNTTWELYGNVTETIPKGDGNMTERQKGNGIKTKINKTRKIQNRNKQHEKK